MNRFQGRAVATMAAIFAFVGVTQANAKIAKMTKEPEAVPGEYVVKIKPQYNIQNYSINTIANSLGAYVKNTISDLNLVVIKRPVFETRQSVMQQLAQNPSVQYVEPNYIYHINKTPNDPMLGQLWGMSNTGAADSEGHVGTAGVDIGALQAWDIETGSDKVLVAVVDTGIDYNSPDLQANVWTNEAELNGKAGVDDDNNGIIDDIHGANFVDAAHPTGDPMDDHGHGSHCSGTIGANGNDGKGLVGVNWKTRILAAKFLDANGSGTLDGAVQAINYATKMGARVLSNSWGGGGYSQALFDAIQKSNEANAVFVAAAGNESNDNDSNPTYPASYDVPNVLAVAAIDNKGQLASFSSYGKKKVHVGAPGVNIVSITKDGYQSWSGTSMATPHVSGIAALVASHFPDMKNLDIKARIIATAKPDRYLKKKVLSGGIANAYTALANIIPAPDMNDPVHWSSKDISISTAHPYVDKTKLEQTVNVPGAKEISIYFAKFSTEQIYDTVEIFDGTGKLIQKLTGNNDDSFSDPIPGDTAKIVFTSDDSATDYGFDITKVAYR